MFLADLHIHSTFSDGRLTIPQLVDLFGQRGCGAIAITDHLCEENTIWGRSAHALGLTLTKATFPLYREILKSERNRAWREYRMILIPGVEITKNALSDFNSAHILSLGTLDYISADDPVDQVLQNIRAAGGLSVAAHPLPMGRFDKQTLHLWHHRERLRDLVDVWEIANGCHFFEEVQDTDLAKLANSDFHRRGDFGSWKTILRSDRDPDAIRDAILNQNTHFAFIEETHAAAVPGAYGLAALDRLIDADWSGNLAPAPAF